MQLRTFLAKDMREALATVRADMGPDAVIIASEKSKTGGVMVRAAIDRPEPEAAAPAPVQTAVVTDFDSAFQNSLLKRLRGSAVEKKSAIAFDRMDLLSALNKH